jgi:hypothetical protein
MADTAMDESVTGRLVEVLGRRDPIEIDVMLLLLLLFNIGFDPTGPLLLLLFVCNIAAIAAAAAD